MLLLDERILADGRHACTYATVIDDRVRIRDDNEELGDLSIAALDRVMVRYGKPLDLEVEVDDLGLAFTGGYRLRRLRYHAIVDATGRDYLVWERPDGEPLAAIGAMVTAALRYLVLRLSAERDSSLD
ncbi:MAG: hypothetical protein H0V17_15885 [Deltaproteobacteria bacterium]|nr:hypothetical protein [Deltaproteobacteria bacterium]